MRRQAVKAGRETKKLGDMIPTGDRMNACEQVQPRDMRSGRACEQNKPYMAYMTYMTYTQTPKATA